ncbi:MAG TPA: hypothetical protein V8P47_00790 [Candidatus Azosocius sp. HAIN]
MVIYTNEVKYTEIFIAIFLFFLIIIIDAWLVWKFTSPLMVPLYHVININSYDVVINNILNSNFDVTIFNNSL